MNELLDYARELKKEFETQEHDCQAHPRFWVIMDYKDQVTSREHADKVEFWDRESCEAVTIEDYKEEILERIEDGEFSEQAEEEIRRQLVVGSFEDLIDAVDEYGRFSEVYSVEAEYIVPNTFFLTKQDAKDYLRKYGYNHSPKSHTYAMTAIRSPKFQQLIDLIMEVDQ